MPGAFAHLTMVNTLVNADALDSIPGLSDQIKAALGRHSRFCDLGAVSPDYPYLKLAGGSSKAWADVMHYWQTADFIRRGVRHLSAAYPDDFSSNDAQKCIAWLFGYTAHVVTDMAVHPVVQAKVGPYNENKRRHRVCEMNQDVYILDRLLNLEVKKSEFANIIENCKEPGNRFRLDTAVTALWSNILGDVSLDDVRLPDGGEVPTDAPHIHLWHACFTSIVDAVEEVVPFVARVTEICGLTYPRLEEVDQDYIVNLSTPAGEQISYEEVFRRAQSHVKRVWGELGAAIDARNPDLFTLINGNLDTGLELAENVADARPIFWRA